MEEIFKNPGTLLILAWSLVWKGWALWRASKNDQKYWFIALLLLNTVGILEIIYLTFFQKKDRLWNKIIQKKILRVTKK
ncbi:hypothetical protein COU96_03250 [Candidatus Shapirobacteria bacterium CG10_big_fil_rev_8_21_14_0_10_38_14]|uniref:DUF5652 domain-containing protein n=1 Tax=Candidatus Shapirobacteria bacterium CG10_big_fil_rev_8_21_14_0_10_38_14 TaxID=1974483 RepID=A0A2M8L4T3_9BACT|nr:MAG: hypothetical protein COU96_03250 [Candidatus Shapirobacteria bacterium CG10_big_fil_rev_8_21_14_0_10_38_14]